MIDLLQLGSRVRGGLLVLVLALGACGSGGGGASAVLELSPASVSASFYSREVHEFSTEGSLRGAVPDEGVLVVVDPGEILQEDFDLVWVGDDRVRLTFRTSPGLEPGRRQSRLEIRICDTETCRRSYATATLGYDFEVLPYPVPVLDQLMPSTVLVGSDATDIAVTGSSFTHASEVYWSDVPLATEYVSPTQLVASVPSGLLREVGIVPLTVRNPTPGGGVSAVRDFTVAYPVPQISGMSAVESAAGCGGFPLRIGGEGIFPATTLLWNGSPRPSTMLSPGLLSAEISAADLAAASSAVVSLRNPAPGGGVGSVEAFSVTVSAPPTTDTVTLQINPQHTSRATTRCPVSLPQERAWQFPLEDIDLSYPLVADGRVYFYAGGAGLPLYALDATTGSVVWGPLRDENPNFNLAYDNGRLFVPQLLAVSAFNAENGNLAWRSPLVEANVESGITATNGALYFSVSGVPNYVKALKQSDGSALWTRSVEGGQQSVPAVNAGSVFVSYPCAAYRLSTTDGSVTWQVGGACPDDDSTFAGGTPVLQGTRLLASRGLADSGGKILRVADGAELGGYDADANPAVAPGVRVALQNWKYAPVIRAHDDDGNLLWTFERPYDEIPVWAPVIVNNLVLVATADRRVWALDLHSGVPLWSGTLGHNVRSGDNLSVGGGVLVVRTHGGLSAFDLGGRE